MRRVSIVFFIMALAVVTLLQGCGREPGEREYKLAIDKYNDGQLIHAKSLFESSINKRRGDAAANAYAFNWLGVIEWKLGRREDAKAYFEQSHRKDPTLPETLYNLGVIAYEENDPNTAISYFNDAALANPKDIQSLQFIAQIDAELGRVEEAKRALDEALNRKPSSADILTRLAVLELKEGRVQDAVKNLMSALEMDKKYAPALFNLAVINDKYLDNVDEAKSYYKEFLLLEREGPYVLEARKALTEPVTQEVLQALATATPRPTATLRPTATATPARPTAAPPPPTATPRPTATPLPAATATPRPTATSTPIPTPTPVIITMDAKAIEAYNRHMETARANSAAGKPNVALNEFIGAAKIASEYGRSDLMEDAFANAAAHCFDLAPAHFAYGKFLMAKGRYPEALNSFKQASVLSPGSPAIEKPLAEAAMMAEEYDTALISLKKVNAREPENADVLWNMALIYREKTGQDAKAIVNFQEFVSRFPKDPRAEEARGYIREIISRKMNTENRPTPAPTVQPTPLPPQTVAPAPTPTPLPTPKPISRPTSSKPTEEDRRNALLSYNKGVQSVRAGDWDKAIYYFRRAVEIDPGMVNAWFNLGLSQKRRGQDENALKSYLKSLELKPDMSAARYNLALLYFDRQQFTNAEKECTELLRFDPGYASAHLLLGLIYERNPATKTKAIYHYEQFLRYSPDAPEAPGVRQWLQRNAKSFSRT